MSYSNEDSEETTLYDRFIQNTFSIQMKDIKSGISITNSAVIFRYDEPIGAGVIDLVAKLDGIDFSYNQYFTNQFGVEYGVYYGSTDVLYYDFLKKKDEKKYIFSVPMSSYSDYRNVSVYGIRSTIIGGLYLRDPGFRVFLGLGGYLDYIELDRVDGRSLVEIDIGSAIKFGLGYNWEKISVDFWGSVRSDGPTGFSSKTAQGGWRLTYYF